MGSKRVVSAPETLSQYEIARGLLRQSARDLARLSDTCREAVVLWTGLVASPTRAIVTAVIVPVQVASKLHFDVSAKERIRIATQLSNGRELLLAQLHTHPCEAFHSSVDDRLAIPRHTGAISIVVPNFATGWTGDLLATSVNRHLGAGQWEELSPIAVQKLFKVLP